MRAEKITPETQESFAALLERHRKIVLKVANTYAYDPEDRADLAQEIAAQLWRAFPSYDPGRPFSTWMYRIALNVAISHLRSRKARANRDVPLDEERHGAIGDPRVDPDPTDERIRALHRFIAQLGPLDRALLLLYLDDHSHADIAGILGISETNVSTKVSRLKQRIRTEMKG